MDTIVNSILEERPMDTIVKEYPATPAAVADARAFVAEQFAGHPDAYDARLLVTELAANAVKYGIGDKFVVRVQHRIVEGHAEIRVWVKNVGDTVPDVAASGYENLQAESQRGLALVADVASRWGFGRTARHVIVWFDFPEAPALLAA